MPRRSPSVTSEELEHLVINVQSVKPLIQRFGSSERNQLNVRINKVSGTAAVKGPMNVAHIFPSESDPTAEEW